MAELNTKAKTMREAYWREHIRACESSGSSIAGYCQRQGLSVGQYHWWKRELKRRGLVAGTPVPARFAEVRVISRETAAPALIEVGLGNGRRIGVYPGFDGATLSAVVRVLEGLGC